MRERERETHKNYVAIKRFTTRLIRTNLSMAVKGSERDEKGKKVKGIHKSLTMHFKTHLVTTCVKLFIPVMKIK
jgi:hypothetical protein